MANNDGDGARFVAVGDGETGDFVELMKNANTRKKTVSDIKILKDWLISVGELRNPEDIPVEAMNMYLARFFIAVRTKDRKEYEPDSLKCIQSSIHRYLNEKSNISILKDKEFAHSRDVLGAKRKALKGKGLGNKKRRADPFTSDEIDSLFNKNLLGISNPEALTNTVWLNNSLHFGMRSRQEHTDMLFGDVTMKATSEGKHYLEYSERMTKTRQGESGNTRSFAPKMFENPGDPRCPVNAFKEFMKRRPVDTLTPDSRMYLSTLHNITPDSTFPPIRALWFSKQPLGKNKLGDLAKTMSLKAGLTGRKVNHSARKTTVTSLLHSNVEATQIMQLTGHRNVQSINQYSSSSLEQQEKMSNILSDISSGNRGSIANKPGNVSDQPSTSTHNIEHLTDDDLTNVDVDAMVACIESYEENSATMATSNSAQPTVIDLAPIMPNSRVCVLPYSKISGNVTINFYGVNDKN
ncbi:uncharacterized protein KIAA1958-like [Mytilus trossulus]|uniref:uncharacterized protein KIAA1958-like n=1 Tax=Mytilus trossulus TaxID=6551 RepID=UPI003005B1B5